VATKHRVDVRLLAGRGAMPAAELRRIAQAVLAAENVALTVGVEVILADADTVRTLNRLYRGKDEPTDVLSFATAEVDEPFIEDDEEPPSLGEIVVCYPVAKEQAEAAGRPLAGEVAHLLVHGLLHVTGHDHESPAESKRMQDHEDELLTALGYAGQYAHGHLD
jgi:probable rRNA maturation factor